MAFKCSCSYNYSTLIITDMAGKGDTPRKVNKKQYNDNFDKIKPSGKLDGFIKVKGKLIKKY